MRRLLRFSVPLLLIICARPCAALEAPEPGVVTLRSGDLQVELQRSHAWNIQRIMRGDVQVATATGSYGTLLSVPAVGGWIGGAHTVGGVESIESISLTVDGEEVPLEPGAAYSGDLLELHRTSLLDMVRLDATLWIDDGRMFQRHTLTALEDVIVTVAYPFMFCVTSDTMQWIAETADGESLEGAFTGSRDLDWHEDWAWTAAYIPDAETGFVMRHLSRAEGAATLTGYWDQERHHKLYVRWDSPKEPWREGYTLSGEVAVTTFSAAPEEWEDVARGAAEGLIVE